MSFVFLNASAGAQTPGVVARLGGIELPAAEVRRLLESQAPEVRAQIRSSPEALDRLVRTELIRRALLVEAQAKGWDKQPEVAAAIERAREQIIVTSYVNNLARPPANYPSEGEIKAFYEANRAQFVQAPQFHLAQIYIQRPSGDGAAAETAAKKAGELARQAKAPGADFAALARASSEHAESASRGGDMGWVADSQIIPELRPVLAKLANGAVSEPIEIADGWHVVQLIDSRPAGALSLDAVRPAIVNTLRLQRAQDIERAYIDQLLAKTPVNIDEAELAKLRGALR